MGKSKPKEMRKGALINPKYVEEVVRDTVMRAAKRPVEEEAKLYECPECDYVSHTPEPLGVHIERHAPVDKPIWAKRARCPSCNGRGCFTCYYRGRRLRSYICPMGCGRHYHPSALNHRPLELAVHMALCTGEEPLERLSISASMEAS